jgi:hypothetical protein
MENIVDHFFKWDSKTQVKWIMQGRNGLPVASGELGDPCRWCVHFVNMCNPYPACTHHSNFRCRPRKQINLERFLTSANTAKPQSAN